MSCFSTYYLFKQIMLFVAAFLLQFCVALGDGPGVEDDAYILNFDSPVYVCADEESEAFVETSQIEVKRHNETISYMTGILSFLKSMPPKTTVELVIDKEISGFFERFVSHEICDLCKELEDPESDYRDYFKQLGFPKKCPFEANDYHLKEFVAITKDLPINSATVGRYQVTMTISESASSDCLSPKTFLACLKFDCIIEPL